MLTVRATAGHVTDIEADVVVVPVFKGGIEGPGTQPALDALGLDRVPVTSSFRGDIGQHLAIGAPGSAFRSVLFVGLGRMDEVDSERLRRAAGLGGRHAQGARVATTLAEVHPTSESVTAVVEGFLLGSHRDDRFKSVPSERLPAEELRVLVPSSLLPDSRDAVARGRTHAEATIAARHLVDLPPDRKRPADLAQAIAALAGASCEVTIRDEAWLREAGYGGLLAVGQGSSAPPRLVELRYRPDEPLGTVVLVGKGITFDTGGLSLKRGDAMTGMKADMAGAAAIAAACAYLPRVECPMEVVALLGLAENMPGASAQRPGDVLTIRGGTTVEVVDTDAEGRLVLADLLSAAGDEDPDAVVDCATLTGAAVTALGHYVAAVMGTDDTLVDALVRAGAEVGETYWRLPLVEDYRPFLDSAVADCVNFTDVVGAGAVTAGLFLRRFVGDHPWAHLDIAGPALLSERLAHEHLPAGGTGFGARTLLAWLGD
jgi:leucyl aminopeptidase